MKSSKQSMMQQELFCSPEGFLDLANHSVVPGSSEAQKITAISGRKCFELYQKQNRNGLLVKMSEGLLVTTTAWFSRIVVLTWKEKVTPCKRLLFQLAPSAPRTEGIGCGLLGTPRAEEGGNRSEKFIKGRTLTIKEQIAMLPTAMICTPTASQYKGAGCNHTVRNRLDYDIEKTPNGKKTGLKLHSDFVSWMMNYPLDWLDI